MSSFGLEDELRCQPTRDSPYSLCMALKLENDFVVAAPIDQVWAVLLDLERVASCLPGATITPSDEPNTYLGTMRVKLGPVTMHYKGKATLGTVDEAARTATFTVEGNETRGNGTASATITNRLREAEVGTKVAVETELSVTGRAAQFGHGIMQDVASAMLSDFAKCLSQVMAGSAEQVAGDGSTAPVQSGPTLAASAEPPLRPEPETLKVGGIVGRVLLGRLRALFSFRPRR
jgi:uncharacterized protein